MYHIKFIFFFICSLHTHLHAHVHTCTHTHTYTHATMHTYIHTCTHAHTCMHTYTCTHAVSASTRTPLCSVCPVIMAQCMCLPVRTQQEINSPGTCVLYMCVCGGGVIFCTHVYTCTLLFRKGLEVNFS